MMLDRSIFISKNYTSLSRYCSYMSWIYGLYMYYEDIFHECLLTWLLKTKPIEDENHEVNLIRKMIRNLIIDKKKALKVLFDIDDQYEHICIDDGSDIYRLTDEEFNKLRDISSSIRSDDFIDPNVHAVYPPNCIGWVSGWVHSYVLNGRQYVYWLYSAFVGSRSKNEIPRRIKTSKSRHIAYMGLMEYNHKVKMGEKSRNSLPIQNEYVYL